MLPTIWTSPEITRMAINWNSTTIIQDNADSFAKLVHVVLGIYIWEWYNSLDFEYKVITGKHKFRWPLVFYFLNRYTLLFALIGFAITLNVQRPLNCQPLNIFIQTMGSLAAALACLNLAIRAMAIWKCNRIVVYGLTVIILGHWALLINDIGLAKSRWIDGQGCIITEEHPQLLTGAYIYAMGIDFIVMCLMAVKTGWRVNKRMRLIKILIVDGFVYFIVAFLVNLVAAVFSALNLNPIMSVIALVPATALASIAACRAVRHLTVYVNRDSMEAEVIDLSLSNSTVSRAFNRLSPPAPAHTRPTSLVVTPAPISPFSTPNTPVSPSSSSFVRDSPGALDNARKPEWW